MSYPTRRMVIILALIVMPLYGQAQVACAQMAGESVIVHEPAERDLYLAGGSVDVLAPVEGDVVAGGGRVTVGQAVSGDVIAAGGSVTVRGEVGDDVRLAGGEVTLFGAVADDALMAGGSVTLAPTATVGSRAWLAGGTVQVAGRVGEELRAGGGRVTITGTIGGDAHIVAQSLEIGPGAVIEGDLNYRSPREAAISPQARIGGRIHHQPMEEWREPSPGAVARALAVPLLISLMVTGIVLYLLFPHFSVLAARNVGVSPWRSLGLGLAVFAATPLVVMLLMMTLVGLWLALMLLAAYLILLLTGLLTGVLYLGDAGLRRGRRARPAGRGWYVLAIVLALLLVVLVLMIPFLGALLVFLLLLAGLGALVLEVYRHYSGAPHYAG